MKADFFHGDLSIISMRSRTGTHGGNMALAVNNADPRAFRAQLGARLRAGSHLILYGPRGMGKSTLTREIAGHCKAIGVPCGLAPETCALSDIIAALAQAYPYADIEGLRKRAIAVRLHRAADRAPGILLLDHSTMVTTAMLGYLRRLRGGIAGALLVADVDSSHERDRLKGWQVGAPSIRMPIASRRRLRRILAAASHAHSLPDIEPQMRRYILRVARGRIGWVTECIRRLQMPEYWRDARLHLAAICMDTEIAIRQSRDGPRTLRRRGST
jgi:energy-coupling factor transporter ATP-binding protein EcfA2